jgi:membrane protein
MKKLYIKFKNLKAVRFIVNLTRKIVLPGFDGVPLYDVLKFFLRGLLDGAITTRASSIAFKFFIALFPAIIFLFTIIPYIPIENFHETLLLTIKGLLPNNFYAIISGTVEDIILRQRTGLLSIGFIMALYFSSNGLLGMITAFNSTTHSIETRSIWKQYLISFLLVLILSLILLVATTAIIGGTVVMQYLVNHKILESSLVYNLIKYGKWLIIVIMLFFAISFMYYLAPARKTRFRFISAGSTFATLLFILATVGFNFYVNNFASYNALYGSIGTLIVIMMWLYFNALVLIIGFELNASIAHARHHKDEDLKVDALNKLKVSNSQI